MKRYLLWEEVNITWEQVDMLWEDVSIIIDAFKKGGSSYGSGLADYIKNNPWDVSKKKLGEERAKKFIKIVCNINGLDYEEVMEIKDKPKINIKHIEKVYQESLKIGIKLD